MYQRKQVEVIKKRMDEIENPLLQVVVGPRQTGKSTMLAQALSDLAVPSLFVSADEPIDPSGEWLQTEWQQARNLVESSTLPVVFVVDEIQKVADWPRVVKALWDSDRRNGVGLKVFLSGSSSLLLHRGLEESLMGRFELIRSPHWTYAECREAFDYTLDDFLYYGGFPGAARFVHDDERWASYVRDSIIEPTISQDVLALGEVRKPALMRSLFRLSALYSGQELSYNKMLGQLQDAGNTVTLANYLDLLDKAGIIAALPKHHAKELERRRTSPRLMVYDTSLMCAISDKGRDRILGERDLYGHVLESAVGAYLLGRGPSEGFEIRWWREGAKEVDFILQKGSALTAIEVKGGVESRLGGMHAFLLQNPQARRIVVGGAASGACGIEEFLLGEVPLFC